MKRRSSLARACLPFLVVAASCTSSAPPAPPPNLSPPLLPGELCDPGNTAPVTISFDPPSLVLAPGQTRAVRVLVSPDFCVPAAATFTMGDGTIARGPSGAAFDLRHATNDFTVVGLGLGTTNLTMSLQRPQDKVPTTAPLPVEVRPAAIPTCSGGDSGATTMFGASQTIVQGAGNLVDATVSINPNAFVRTDEFATAPFNASIHCDVDLASALPRPMLALGPAVEFRPESVYTKNIPLRREIEFSVPANPAAMPFSARARHIEVLYQGPRTQNTPRSIPVATPRFVKLADGSYVLRFSSAYFGTYQAVVAPDAGTRHYTRHITHRAVIGFSMGGGGAATFGLRHHDRLDAIGSLGGPNDWNWLLWYISTFHLGGFCPASQPKCMAYAPNLYPLDEPYAHTQDYEHWFSQSGDGTGGTFSRNTYSELFWDLTAMFGNPNGQNADPNLSFFPAGPKATDPWVTGDQTGFPPGTDCLVPVNAFDGDTQTALHQMITAQCNQSRCDPSRTWKAPTGYYNAEFNPFGGYQVISVCDGNQAGGVDPYLDQWAPPTPSTAIPLGAALAVDLNGNGVRDQGEPLIQSGHEPWSDVGVDGVADENEPGYDPVLNPDPNGDDYDPQLNPTGTEGDHRYELGEPFQDVGLDGVPGTLQQSAGGYDVGEGDGVYTQTTGLSNFQAVDPHGMVLGWANNIPGGPLDDAALQRLDIMIDGGIRDLFNFEVDGGHFAGAIYGRKRADGSPLKHVHYYNNFDYLPGEVNGQPESFDPAAILWSDVATAPVIRYGDLDATAAEIEQGDGKHVGTALQILDRVETSFYFAAKSWSDADRVVTDESRNSPETTTINELGTTCEIAGTCEKNFTGPVTQRTGPIAITLPPGYALEANRLRDVRYPVLYVLHGYGQDPRDLESVALITNNFMNDAIRSYATRLPKFIVVYVDGRCRVNAQGYPECVEGTFYVNSDRPNGPQMDSWFVEVMNYMDQNYRTLGPVDVDVIE